MDLWGRILANSEKFWTTCKVGNKKKKKKTWHCWGGKGISKSSFLCSIHPHWLLFFSTLTCPRLSHLTINLHPPLEVNFLFLSSLPPICSLTHHMLASASTTPLKPPSQWVSNILGPLPSFFPFWFPAILDPQFSFPLTLRHYSFLVLPHFFAFTSYTPLQAPLSPSIFLKM